MIPIICVDEELGMMFEDQRLLENKDLRSRILEISARDCLWMNTYTADCFADGNYPQIIVDDDFLEKAGTDDYVLVEDRAMQRYRPEIRRVLLMRWEKAGKATRVLDLDVDNWLLMVAEDLPTSDGMFTIEVMKP